MGKVNKTDDIIKKFNVYQCKQHKFKAKKVGNPMVYECLRCGEIVKSKKDKK